MQTDNARAIAHAVVADLLTQYLDQTAATPGPEDELDRRVAAELRALQDQHARRGRAVFSAVAHSVRVTLVCDAAGEPLMR